MNIPLNLTLNKYDHKEVLAKLTDANMNNAPVLFGESEMNSGSGHTEKKITSKRDLKCFQMSSTYSELLNFIIQLSLDIGGKPLKPDAIHSSAHQPVQNVLNLLIRLDEYVDQIPPKPVRTRFGNESFVEWHQRVESTLEQLLNTELLGQSSAPLPNLFKEAGSYLLNCFGDKTRIDYGSGHELNFICFLLCLVKLNYLKREHYEDTILKIFYSYLCLMRKLQKTYWLEPAGSHGVWGLDDYHFLPFLFGSSQLIEHKYIRPKSVRNAEIVDSSYSREYMYLGCIDFIMKVKSGGSLLEHSPMLVDISGVKNWSKVNEGMIKMYKTEVLSKLPIMQHFLFGQVLPFIDNPDIKDDPSDLSAPRPIVTHSFSCCGCVDKVPSVFAANTFKNTMGELNLHNEATTNPEIQTSPSSVSQHSHGHDDHQHHAGCSHPTTTEIPRISKPLPFD